jgi:hypothetical protein
MEVFLQPYLVSCFSLHPSLHLVGDIVSTSTIMVHPLSQYHHLNAKSSFQSKQYLTTHTIDNG